LRLANWYARRPTAASRLPLPPRRIGASHGQSKSQHPLSPCEAGADRRSSVAKAMMANCDFRR
jgi:hypothetical protein